MNILTGALAAYVLKHILDDYEKGFRFNTPPITGFFKEGTNYICFDNTSCDCWVEEAETKELALKWCSREIEAEELYFSNGLHYV